MSRSRNREEVARLLDDFRNSGLTRTEYCRRNGITVRTLDYYRRRGTRSPSLVRVKVEERPESTGSLSVLLSNGRRVLCSPNFQEADLVRLIRIAESA
jgi:hypothetical protein